MKNFSYIFLLAALMISTNISVANNITVSNVSLTGQNTGSQYSLVQFDLSWDNSWRTSSAPNNWDAAWVFVKYRVTVANGGDGLWHHASLNDAGHTPPTGSTIDIGLLTPETAFDATTNPVLGAFVYNSRAFNGTNNFTGAQLQWNYGVNYKTGTTPIGDNDVVDIQVFAIEMVSVPEGNFYVGSGGIEASSFTTANSTSGATVPFQITSTAPTLQGNNGSSSASNLSARGNFDLSGTTSATIATGFPTGFSAFYCMKYEISQQGYVDFLNTLTYTQQVSRTLNTPSSVAGTGALVTGNTYRNGIDIQTSGVTSTTPAVYACNLDADGNYSETVDGQWIACNLINWTDLAAYLDWSGLRPMTELEFEKACRGTGSASANEYAWGTTDIAGGAYTLSNSGATDEVIATNYSTTVGNALYANFVGNAPLRVGIFAGTIGNTGRVTAGATYYGIMEMSGNLWEPSVTVGNSTGRLFTGTNGNGSLNATGDADATTWPGTAATGAGIRGGGINSATSQMTVSYRAVADGAGNGRGSNVGGRGVRTAPQVPFAIGQSYGGGIIFYIDETGQHGLIAAESDQSSGIEWITGGSTQTTVNSNTSTAIGTGQANTNFMMAQADYTGGAAKVCNDYTNTETGTGVYSDWYLPSKTELFILYLQNAAVGGFVTNNDYWSSSESNYYAAWVQFLTTGGQNVNNKSAINPVRAIRSF